MLLSRQDNYLHGDCWLFALELNRYMGWEMVQYWQYEPHSYHHVLCKTPDERFIDATGWVIPPVATEKWPRYPHQAMQWARQWNCAFPDTRQYLVHDVETLLFKLGISWAPPTGHCTLTELGLKS